MLLRILGIVFPIFAVVAAGWAYARYRANRGGIDMTFANQLNMEVFVPALVFAALTARDFDLVAYDRLALGALAVVLFSGLIGWGLARLTGEAPKTFAPPMMFVNAGNMGLPLMVLAFGESALPAAVVLFFAENFLHYSLGTWMLDHRAKLWNLWRVPVIAAALAGLAVSTLHFPLWQPLWLSVKLLGDVSIPLLLFSLGVRLTDSRHADLHISLAGAITSPVAGVLVALLMNLLLGLTGRDAAMLILFGALPPAVLNYIFAERYRQEPERVASMVLVGNMASLAIIPLTLAWVLR